MHLARWLIGSNDLEATETLFADHSHHRERTAKLDGCEGEGEHSYVHGTSDFRDKLKLKSSYRVLVRPNLPLCKEPLGNRP